MDREFWREWWPVIGFGLLGITGSTIAISSVTGQPLLPHVDFRSVLASYAPGAMAILKGIGLAVLITIATAVTTFVILYVRAWIERKMEKLPKRASKSESSRARDMTVNDYRQKHPMRVAVPIETDSTKRAISPQALTHALLERIALRNGIIALLNRHHAWSSSGEREKASAEILIASLGQMVSELEAKASQPVAMASQTVLNAPSWREIAELVSWTRKAPAIRLRASRDAFRAIGIQVPDADLQPGGAFNEWVRGLNVEPMPSPTAPIPPAVDEKQATDNGHERRTLRRTRALPRKRFPRG